MTVPLPDCRRVPRPAPLAVLLLAGALAGCDPQLGVDPAWADRPLPSAELSVSDSIADVGAELFRRNCVACHSVGGGDVVGPDLAGVTTRRPITWIRGMVARPDSMLRVDGVAQAMLLQYQVPMLNRELDAARVRAILEFLWRADHPPENAADRLSRP
ncbi:MAG TPA: cytochrome c [Longimicrobiales bacterium]|nr:cytochrome c [Longimicrobiales bacterium]